MRFGTEISAFQKRFDEGLNFASIRRTLDEEMAGAAVLGRLSVLRRVMAGQDGDASTRAFRLYSFGQLKAGCIRQPEVHKNDLRSEDINLPDGLFAVGGFLDVYRREPMGQLVLEDLSEDRVILYKQYQEHRFPPAVSG